MAFDALNNSEISAGEPTKQELWSKSKGNQDDHETRLQTLEASLNAFHPIHFFLNGAYGRFALRTKLDIQRIAVDLNLLAGRVYVETAGSAGDTEIDILYKRGVGSWTSIFSTKPKVNFSAGNDSIGSGILSVTSLLAGDLVRMDMTAKQTNAENMSGILEIEGS